MFKKMKRSRNNVVLLWRAFNHRILMKRTQVVTKTILSPYKDFNMCQLPTCEGTLVLSVVHSWIIDLEMDFCACIDEQRL